ncbi:hypothetical protein ADUPG1_001987, partial [Aduncisulcus paluster]
MSRKPFSKAVRSSPSESELLDPSASSIMHLLLLMPSVCVGANLSIKSWLIRFKDDPVSTNAGVRTEAARSVVQTERSKYG